ncbi:Hypothetical_protein [Hexamita inflata]|uniref:Hypothetical_protein n=1 Tax=Hexamita inflata TaxID=28002 RepID=A0ABP1K353_9EUKA
MYYFLQLSLLVHQKYRCLLYCLQFLQVHQVRAGRHQRNEFFDCKKTDQRPVVMIVNGQLNSMPIPAKNHSLNRSQGYTSHLKTKQYLKYPFLHTQKFFASNLGINIVLDHSMQNSSYLTDPEHCQTHQQHQQTVQKFLQTIVYCFKVHQIQCSKQLKANSIQINFFKQENQFLSHRLFQHQQSRFSRHKSIVEEFVLPQPLKRNDGATEFIQVLFRSDFMFWYFGVMKLFRRELDELRSAKLVILCVLNSELLVQLVLKFYQKVKFKFYWVGVLHFGI